MNNKKKKKEEEKIHIHKVVSLQKCSYKRAREKYAEYIDEKSMIPISVLKNVKEL